MGDINQLNFVRENSNLIKGPILEVGGKDYGSTPNFRQFFPKHEYLSIDMEDGKGVDLVLDLTKNIEEVRSKLPIKKFKTILNFSVLEHCANPFKMAENITELLEKDGRVFISVPFAWQVHAYPSDYWRFTPEGVKVLFHDLDFDLYSGNVSSNIEKEIKKIDNNMFNIYVQNIRASIKSGHCSLFSGIMIYLMRESKILNKVFKYPILFPLTMINMIGYKRK